MVVPMMTLMWMVPLLLIGWLVTSALGAQPLMNGCDPAKPVEYDVALLVVRERYARGELSRAQYEQLVAELLRRN
jgi:uncharacterized membrane protein